MSSFFIQSLLLLFFIQSLLLLFFSQSLLPLGPLQRRHNLLLSFTCLFLRLFPSQMSFPPQTRSHLPFLLQQKNYASMKFQEETLEQEISKGLYGFEVVLSLSLSEIPSPEHSLRKDLLFSRQTMTQEVLSICSQF
jgi:hypothetical protein